ncbi:MAG: hypothetical protein AB7I27_07320 [Bacteriovoracaceae bacterium]
MIKILLLFIISFSAWANLSLQLQLPKDAIKQGSLEKAVLVAPINTMEALPLNRLTGKNFGETIYFYRIGPFIRKEKSNNFESDVQVIFVKVPKSASITDKVEGQDVIINWSDVRIIPTEGAENLIFGNFSIPEKFKWPLVLLILSILGFVSGFAWRIVKKLQNKKRRKEELQKIKVEIYGATSFHDVVLIWQNKSFYLKTFPHLTEPLKNLEKVLFKYQFKPNQTEIEKDEVMKAYQEFLNEIRGGFNGI